MIALVKHNPRGKKTFCFKVPEDLKSLIKIGDKVLCDTRIGISLGEVVLIIDCNLDKEAQSLVGVSDSLKEIIAVETKIPTEKVLIPSAFKNSFPSLQKINNRLKEYKATGTLKTFITFIAQENGCVLIDGYTAYLVARMFGLETLEGFCCPRDKLQSLGYMKYCE